MVHLQFLLSFLLQINLLKTNHQRVHPFCHQAAHSESGPSCLWQLHPSRFLGKKKVPSPVMPLSLTLHISSTSQPHLALPPTQVKSKGISPAPLAATLVQPLSFRGPTEPLLGSYPHSQCLQAVLIQPTPSISAEFLAQNPPKALVSVGIKDWSCAQPSRAAPLSQLSERFCPLCPMPPPVTPGRSGQAVLSLPSACLPAHS